MSDVAHAIKEDGAASEEAHTENTKPSAAGQKQVQTSPSKLVAAVFGELISLFMRSPNHKYNTLTDLEWMVLPAVVSAQYRLAEATDKNSGQTLPVAAVLWASVSDELHQQFSENIQRPLRIKPNEWKSGENIWIMEMVGDIRIAKQVLVHLRDNDFQDKTANMRIRNEDGQISSMALDEIKFEADKPQQD